MKLSIDAGICCVLHEITLWLHVRYKTRTTNILQRMKSFRIRKQVRENVTSMSSSLWFLSPSPHYRFMCAAQYRHGIADDVNGLNGENNKTTGIRLQCLCQSIHSSIVKTKLMHSWPLPSSSASHIKCWRMAEIVR